MDPEGSGSMRVLVTGADGFVGSVLCPLLDEHSIEYVGMDVGCFRKSGWKERSWKRVLLCDVGEVSEKDLRGIDAICHLAAVSNDPMGEIDASLTRRINFEYTVRLARLAKKAGVRLFLFSGSCSVYGKQGDKMLNETDPTEPRTQYAQSKIDAEKELLSLESREFSVIVLRNATAYGESPNLRLDLVVNNLSAHAHSEGRILIMSDGTPWRPLIHVEDMSRAFIAFLTGDFRALSGEIFNVGSMEQNYRVSEIATQVQQAFPSCEIEYSPRADTDSRSYQVDFSKLEEGLPSFSCKRRVAESAGLLSRIFEEVELDRDSFESPRFIRLKALRQYLQDAAL